MPKLAGRGRYATETYSETPRSLNGVGLTNVIAWRPDGGGNAKTWDDVMVRIAASPVPMVIDVAPQVLPYAIPASPSAYNLKYATFSSRLAAPTTTVDVLDGAVLQDLSMLSGDVGLQFHSTSGDALKYTPIPNAPGVLAIQRSARIRNAGAVPVITAQPSGGGPGFVLASFENGNIDDGTAPVVAIADNASFIFEVLSAFNTGTTVPPSIASGSALATMLIFHDGTLIFPFTMQTDLVSTPLNVPLGLSPSSGPSSMRPVGLGGPTSQAIGVSYFDTGIIPQRTIWWRGADWVDGAGVVVP